MTGAMVGLAASQLTLVVLLLSLNFRSAWPWLVKAGAITVTFSFFVTGCLALEAMLGWPIGAAPPERFQLHAAVVQEPDRRSPSSGAIYLWLSPPAAAGPPRAYALPYSRPLHQQVARAQSQLQDGRPIEGSVKPAERAGRSGARSYQVELFETPAPALPPKDGG